MHTASSIVDVIKAATRRTEPAYMQGSGRKVQSPEMFGVGLQLSNPVPCKRTPLHMSVAHARGCQGWCLHEVMDRGCSGRSRSGFRV